MKKKLIFIPFLLFCFFFIFSFSVFGEEAHYTLIENWDDFYQEMTEDVMEWNKEDVYYVSFEPKNVEMERVREKVAEKDYALSFAFYGMSYKYEKTAGVYRIEMKNLFYGKEKEFEKAREECERIAEELEGKSDYEKIKFAHDYLIHVSEYSYSNDGPYNCLFRGKSSCNGYMLAFQMIMEACDIPSQCSVNSNHGWNVVYLDGYWYNIDVTWDDLGKEGTSYDYFLKTNEDFPKHNNASVKADALMSYELVAGMSKSEIQTLYIKKILKESTPYVIGVVLLGGAFVIYPLLQQKGFFDSKKHI